MRRQALRFGITDGAGRCAATWKLWTGGQRETADLYLACRGLGGQLKTSLHSDGRWHTAFSKTTFEEELERDTPEGKGRFIERWPRPAPIALGIVLAFRIVTPAASVTVPLLLRKPGIVWLPNAPQRKGTEIIIVVVSAPMPVADWPGKQSGTLLIGSLPLGGGQTAWAVYRVTDLPTQLQLPQGGRYFKGSSIGDLKSRDLRAMLFATAPDGSRVIFDVAVDASGL